MTALVTAFVPPLPSLQGTTFEEHSVINGNQKPMQYQQRIHNGHNVVDLPFGLFQRLLNGPAGKHWEDANPEVLAWMGQGDRRTMSCNAFPGEHRAAPLPRPAPLAAAIVKLRAPKGVTSFSHGGQPFEVGKDGMIEVEGHIAEVAKSHGFRTDTHGKDA